MINEKFLNLEKDSIGTIFYKLKHKRKYTASEKETFINSYVNSYLNRLITDDSLGSWGCWGQPTNISREDLPTYTFTEARIIAHDLWEEQLWQETVHKVEVQVGNKEDLEYLQKLEKRKDFSGYNDSFFIELFKEATKNILSNNESS